MGSIDGSESQVCCYGMKNATQAFCSKCHRCTEEGFMAWLDRETHTFQLSFENTVKLRGLKQAEKSSTYYPREFGMVEY